MSLSTLIVQREIASIREVEEALARQVLYGGDLVTNLLEVCQLDEAQLLPVVAEACGLPAAPAGELPRPGAEAQKLVVAEVATLRNLAPLSVDRYGLVVAVAEPLSREAEQELAFALALPISQRIAPLVRIKQAITRDYGVPLERRLQRLLSRMSAEGRRTAPSEFPPMMRKPSVAEMKPIAPRPPSERPEAPKSAAVEPVRPAVPLGGGRQTLLRQTAAAAGRPIRRRRGPLTTEVAHKELDEAGERDAIFDLLFEYARQYFDYTAVFVVHGEVAEGRDAFGDGASREKVARIGVPLDLESILSLARDKKSTLTKVPSADGLDVVLMSDLARSGKTACVVFPVVVRTRVVALLFGDGGETGIDKAALQEIEGITAQASAAFERVIVRTKLKGTVPPPGALASLVPNVPKPSLAPPTKVSEISEIGERPAVEELAPPIRELMAEPVSRVAPTTREPSFHAAIPPHEVLVSTRGNTDKPPPPPNVLAVRRPSGRPIPREEPESLPNVPVSSAPQTATSLTAELAGSPAPTGPKRTRSQRLQAPMLDFGTVPATSTVVGSEPAPPTSRDREPPPMTVDPAPPSPQSPRAESPPPMRVAARTDVSPGALPMLPAQPNEGGAGERESTPAVMISPHDSDVHLIEPPIPGHSPHGDETPVAPPFDMDATPIAPPVFPLEERVSSDVPRPLSEGSRPPSDGARAMPASEQQISVAAHRPPSSRSDHSRVLPSVIVDVASEYVGLVDRVLETADDEAEAELLRAGGYAMPAIMTRFPGPVTIEHDRLAVGPLPRVAECGTVLRLIASQRRTALPFVLSHVEDPDDDKRFWATYLLTELVYPDVLDPIVSRVFDDQPRVRRAAKAAARAFAEVSPRAITERLELVAMDASEPRDRRLIAIDALGETRDALAVRAIVPLLEDPDDEVKHGVRSALTTLTRQDFGTSSQRWSAWFSANKERHRIEWLIDALMHEQAALRAAAGEELKMTTKEYFGYYDDLPKRERERAQSRYREWWESVGKVRFSRASSSRGS